MLALTIGMGGAILLLLAGTQILDWYWVVLLTLVSLGTGLYRLRNRAPSIYRLAQRIDRRLNLADSLSTAVFFSAKDAHGDPAIRQLQHQDAENVARTVDVRAGVPFTRPRFASAAMGVTLVAIGLFALRYAVTGSLSLEPSLVKMAFDTFFPPQPQLARNASKSPDRFKSTGDDGSPDAPNTQSEEKPDAELQPADAPGENNSQAGDNSKSGAKDGKQTEPETSQPGENAGKDEKSNNANDADQQEARDADSKGDKQNGKQDSKQSSQNDRSSLMNKLRDAMANMMNKMKPSQKPGDQPQQNGQQGGKQDKNQKQQSAKNQDQKSNPDSQNEQQSDDSDQSQSAEARRSEKSSDKNASPDSKSGIGSTDGDKAAKEAAQLAAMGKISEIFGKRSQNVTGEVMMEVGSGKQQLKTPWARKQVTHVEAGSEIHRDEVPLIYQQFVEQYFEEIHKAPAASKKDN